MEMERPDRAGQAYRLALKDNPLLPSALHGYGRYLVSGGHTKKAISYFERAIRAKPNLAESYYELAKLYENTDTVKSINFYRQFQKLVKLDPEFLDQKAKSKDRVSYLKKTVAPDALKL